MRKRVFMLLGLLMGLLAVVGGAAIFAANRVPADDPTAAEELGIFPQLSGTNLLFESLNVPQDLGGAYQLIVVAYDTEQQSAVNKWLRPLEVLNEDYPDLRGYYLPILPKDTVDAALPILGGMTFAASGDRDRERTIVTFTDVNRFNQLVDVDNTDEIQLFLLDQNGQIHWQGVGQYHPDTLQSLETALVTLTGILRSDDA